MIFVGELSALLTAFLWAASSMVFATASSRLGSFKINLTRLILALFYLAILIPMAGFRADLTSRQLLYLCCSGLVGLSVGDTFLFKSYTLIGPRITMLIMSFAPAAAAILSYFLLDETLSPLGIAGIAVTITGISLVVIGRGKNDLGRHEKITTGIAYAFLAALCQGVGLVLAKIAFLDHELNGFVATAVRIFASLLFLLPFGLLTNRYGNLVKSFIQDKRAMWLTIAGSFLGPFFGITFSLIAVANTGVGIASTIMAIVPIIMLPLVKIFYKEAITPRAVAGAVIAVSGVGLLFLR